MPEKFQEKYRIPSARLQGYDYGQNGAYFITICTKNRNRYFGEIIETQYFASLRQTTMGEIANEYWQEIPKHFPFIVLDEYIIMPDHLHGILFIDKGENESLVIGYKNTFGPQSGNISSVIRGYKAAVKSFSTKSKIEFAWQPRFYDHIIWDKDELNRIRNYIIQNPANWFRDSNNEDGLYR